jgi:putative addiction module antidote
MASTLKLIQIGNSTGVILPKELLEKLRVDRGDSLHVMEAPNGVVLSAHNPELERQLDVAERIMREDREILHKLAQ